MGILLLLHASLFCLVSRSLLDRTTEEREQRATPWVWRNVGCGSVDERDRVFDKCLVSRSLLDQRLVFHCRHRTLHTQKDVLPYALC